MRRYRTLGSDEEMKLLIANNTRMPCQRERITDEMSFQIHSFLHSCQRLQEMIPAFTFANRRKPQ